VSRLWRCISLILGAVVLSAPAASAAHGSSPPRGTIWFGKTWTTNSVGDFVVVGRRQSFHDSGRIAWVAHFQSHAGKRTLTFTLWSSESGTLHEIWHGEVHIGNPKINEYANKVKVSDFTALGAKTGKAYSVEYARGSTVLASGRFRLVK
jgi:hypothetical protein